MPPNRYFHRQCAPVAHFDVQTPGIRVSLARSALSAAGVLARSVSEGHVGDFLAEAGEFLLRFPRSFPQKARLAVNEQLRTTVHKNAPQTPGFRGFLRSSADVGAVIFGGEGVPGNRTSGHFTKRQTLPHRKQTCDLLASRHFSAYHAVAPLMVGR